MEENDRVDAVPMRARAWYLGQRIETRRLGARDPHLMNPLVQRPGSGGLAMIFRSGAVVFFGVAPEEQTRVIESVIPHVRGAFEQAESDDLEIVIDPERDGRIDGDGRMALADTDPDRLETVAHVLMKSTALAHFEERIGAVFDRMEPLAATMQQGKWSRTRSRSLLRQLGDVLAAETSMVGRIEVSEKPDLAWDSPDLDRLYERLSAEYELKDRDRALTRKLELISRMAETMHDLLQNRRMLHVELYIVLLIAVEIVIMVYEMTVGW